MAKSIKKSCQPLKQRSSPRLQQKQQEQSKVKCWFRQRPPPVLCMIATTRGLQTLRSLVQHNRCSRERDFIPSATHHMPTGSNHQHAHIACLPLELVTTALPSACAWSQLLPMLLSLASGYKNHHSLLSFASRQAGGGEPKPSVKEERNDFCRSICHHVIFRRNGYLLFNLSFRRSSAPSVGAWSRGRDTHSSALRESGRVK
ncbi:hypothetical protein IWX90DRAFT_233851 [Phyllosticta citrichinensis]|uniref:Uncharacterized protein n=1 Tax=Phyllosticta citrichinensis TaxID=1130410 RepID=A0ABR1XV68_9PEZI